MKSNLMLALAALSLLSLALVGCNKAEEAATAAADAGKTAVNTTVDAGKTAVDTTVDAGKDAAGKMSAAVAGTLDTASVKAAIIADAGLNDPKNEVNVDVNDKGIFLKGHVASNDLKKKAGEIATKCLTDAKSDKKVVNQLLVK
jgi:osmotically-inducible protein OsmY